MRGNLAWLVVVGLVRSTRTCKQHGKLAIQTWGKCVVYDSCNRSRLIRCDEVPGCPGALAGTAACTQQAATLGCVWQVQGCTQLPWQLSSDPFQHKQTRLGTQSTHCSGRHTITENAGAKSTCSAPHAASAHKMERRTKYSLFGKSSQRSGLV